MDTDKLRNIAATLAISYDPAISDEDIATISDAAVEIERLTMQRDEARQAASRWSCEAGAEIARLRAIIESAPHGVDCAESYCDRYPCNCWKKDALT